MAQQPPPTAVGVLIIGGGFAGLSAALALARQRHTVVVFDSQHYHHDPAREINVLSTWEHKAPSEYLAAAREELLRYGTVQLEVVEVVTLAKNKEIEMFEATDTKGQKRRGKKGIIASGVQEIFPDIVRYKNCWGKGIFHCLFCQGYEQSGEAAASAGVLAVQMLAMPRFAVHMAHMAAQLVPHKVTVYTHGSEALAQDIMAESGTRPAWTTDTRAIQGLEMHAAADERASAVTIYFENGSTVTEGFLAHSPLLVAKGPWADQLGLALTQARDYEVNSPFSETSVKGVYAAGDCMTTFKVAANAIANGSTTGAGVAVRLQEEEYDIEPMF